MVREVENAGETTAGGSGPSATAPASSALDPADQDPRAAERLLEVHRRLDRIMTRLAVDLLGADTEVDGTIVDRTLAELGELIGADRTYVFEFDRREPHPTMSNTFEWCAPGIEPARDLLQDLPIEVYSWTLARLPTGPIVVSDLSELPPEAAAERDILQQQGISGVVIIGLFDGGELVGFVGADRVGGCECWDDLELAALEQFGVVLSACLGRLHSRAALRRSEQRLQRLADRLDVGLAILDTDPTRGRFVNPAFERLTGTDTADFAADPESVLGIVHPDDLGEIVPPVRALLDRTETMEPTPPDHQVMDRIVRVRGDDTWRWIRLRVFSLDDDDRPGRLGVLIDDVTAAKRLEEELTIALERASAADRTKTTFLSHVNHELRGPLQGIIGFLQLLRDDPDSADRDELLELTERSARRLAAMIEDLRRNTRIEQGRVEVVDAQVDLGRLMFEAIDLARPDLERHQVTATAETSGDPLLAVTDEGIVSQILLNLISNAAKYNRPDGSVRVIGRHRRRAGEAPEAVLEVIDTGRGLTRDQIERIFVPFERFDADHSPIPGTGIGLPVVKALVRAIGARIEIESEPGVGSTFRVTIPLTPDQRRRRAAYRILSVCRDAEGSAALEAALGEIVGVEVISARHLDAAFSTAVLDHPDLVIVAGSLVERYGPAALVRFAALSGPQRSIEVVAVGSDPSPDIREVAARNGAIRFLDVSDGAAELLAFVEERLSWAG